MVSAWIAPFDHGNADFYSWDGSYQRTLDAPGNLLASIDGHYFVNLTTHQLSSSTGIVVRSFTEPGLDQGSTALNWASDGDYFCGMQRSRTGYWLVLEDVAGNVQDIRMDVPSDVVAPDGIRSMGIQCSLTANRALVFGGSYPHSRVALISLPDGHPIADVILDTDSRGAGSSDLRWLAATNSYGIGGSKTEVVDLTNGAIDARLDGYFPSFTPDSQHLVGTDERGAAALVDWRSKTELWTGPGYFNGVLDSDPATNKVLLTISNGWAQAGTEVDDYWIVAGSGSGFRFNPAGCTPIEASPARVCGP
jgi:hypothetical protein